MSSLSSDHTPLIPPCSLKFRCLKWRHLHHQTWRSGQSLHHHAESNVSLRGIRRQSEKEVVGSQEQESTVTLSPACTHKNTPILFSEWGLISVLIICGVSIEQRELQFGSGLESSRVGSRSCQALICGDSQRGPGAARPLCCHRYCSVTTLLLDRK